jgi:hypothetical protein
MNNLTEQELTTIREKYYTNRSKFGGAVVLAILISFLLCILPAELLGRRGRNIDGSMLESFGGVKTLIFFLGCVCLQIFLANKILKPFKLKNDLKHKRKVYAVMEVKQRGMIPKKMRDELKKEGEDLTDYIIFEKNKNKIKNLHFDRKKNPEFLTAKKVQFELAEFSGIEFGRQPV